MNIVLEGPDGAGKSTLFQAMRLDRRFRHPKFRFVDMTSPSHRMREYIKELEVRELRLFLSMAERDLWYVHDRFAPVTHAIYSRLWPARKNSELVELEDQIEWARICVIVLGTAPEVLEQRTQGRESDSVREKLMDMWRLYGNLREFLPADAKIIYLDGDEPIQNLLSQLYNFLQVHLRSL